MKIIIILFIILSALYYINPPEFNSIAHADFALCHTDDDIDGVIIRNLGAFHPEEGSASSYTDKQLDEWQEKYNKISAWTKTLPDRCIARRYDYWIDFYQGELSDARKEHKTHDFENSIKAAGDESNERIRREDKISPSIPRPPQS